MIRVLLQDYIPPSKRPTGCNDATRKEMDYAWRCQQWQYAASSRSLYTCVSVLNLSGEAKSKFLARIKIFYNISRYFFRTVMTRTRTLYD